MAERLSGGRALDLLGGCLLAGQRGRALEARHVATLLDPGTDLLALAHAAGRHLVTPMLAPAIARTRSCRDGLPEDFRRYLDFVHAENRRRNRGLRRQLAEAAAALNAVGVEPVLLKGAIRLADGLYPDPGWRLMRDLDLLVPRDRLADAAERLAGIGYAAVREHRLPGHWHLPPLARAGDAGLVELHDDLLPLRALCPAAEVIARSRPTPLDGATVRLPVVADQLVHLVAHDRLDVPFRRTRTVPLRSVFELLLLARAEGDVRETLQRFAAAGLPPWPRVALGMAAQLFPDDDRSWPATLAGASGPPLELRLMLALERWDQGARARRVAGYLHARLEGLATSAEARAYFLRSLCSVGYYGRCRRTLGQLWHDRSPTGRSRPDPPRARASEAFTERPKTDSPPGEAYRPGAESASSDDLDLRSNGPDR